MPASLGRIGRRDLLQTALPALALSGCTTAPRPSAERIELAPIDTGADRVAAVTVCTRPFRPAGPRIEPERLGDVLVVHNYGHGGSGWSLAWGSSARAVGIALQAGARDTATRDVAVIGCGVLGLTSAILAQRAGARVTIHAREQLPHTRSMRATGLWSPDSRIALAHVAAPGFAELWEEMARASFAAHRGYLGAPGQPVEWVDQFAVSDAPTSAPGAADASPAPDFASYQKRIADLMPAWRRVPAAAAPFAGAEVSRSQAMMFNLVAYGDRLLSDFRAAGGQFRQAEFRSPAEIAALGSKLVINCTGWGARALWGDETLVPVRGQLTHLVPQPAVRYALNYRHVGTVPRRDGIVVQSYEGGEAQGYGVADETPDPAESEGALATVAELFAASRGRS